MVQKHTYQPCWCTNQQRLSNYHQSKTVCKVLTITGCLFSTPINFLNILAGIMPSALQSLSHPHTYLEKAPPSKVKIWKTFSQSHTRSPSWLWWILEQTMISRNMETTTVMQHIFTICNSIPFWGFDELQLLLTSLMQIKTFADWHCLLWLQYVSKGYNNNKLQHEKA